MKLPIPDDWNGEDWRCVEVQWPDSPLWIAILAGLLTTPTRGRFWDEQTGNIKQVQAVGNEIWNKNFPLNDCSVCPSPNGPGPMPTPVQIGTICGLLERGMNMGLCGYNPKAFKVEDGILYVRDFCGDWVAVGAMTPASEETPASNPLDDPEDPPSWFACGKVSGLIDAMAALVQAALDNYAVPGSFEPACRAAVPNATLGRAAIYLLLTDMIAARKVYSESDIYNADTIQKMKCKAVVGVSASGEVTTDEYTFTLNSVKSAIYEDAPDSAAALVVWTLWEQAYQTIGFNDCILLMELGSATSGLDCSCPDDPDLVSRVRFTGDFIRSGHTGIVFPDDPLPLGSNGRKINMQWQVTGGDWRTCLEYKPQIVGVEDGDFIKMRTWGQWAQSGGSIDPIVPTDDWEDSFADMRNPALWYGLRAAGQDAARTIIGTSALDFTLDDFGVFTEVLVGEGRLFTPGFPDTWFQFGLEIIQLNDTIWEPSYTP